MKRLLPFAFAALLVAACGSVNTIQPQTLALAFKAGDTYKYSFHSSTKQTIAMGVMTIPITVDVTSNESITVKSVDSSGTADLTVTMSNLAIKTVTSNGVTNTTTVPSETSDVKIASDGRPISWNGADLGSGTSDPFGAFSAMGGSFFVTAVLPSGKVKIGDTWTKSYDQASPDGTGNVHITSNSKYLRDESLKGVNAAVVETKSTGTFKLSLDSTKLGGGQGGGSSLTEGLSGMTINGTVTSDVTSWIDPGAHRVMKTHSTTTDTGTMNVQMSSPPASASPGANPFPGLSGPISLNGSATTDLTPA